LHEETELVAVRRLGEVFLERDQEHVRKPLQKIDGRPDLGGERAIHAPSRVICGQPQKRTSVVFA